MSGFKSNQKTPGESNEKVEMGNTKQGNAGKGRTSNGLTPKQPATGSKKVRPQRG